MATSLVRSEDCTHPTRFVPSDGFRITATVNEEYCSDVSMRLRDGWRPSHRCKCVDANPSDWDVEWWCHLPFPMMSVEWLDIGCAQLVHRGMLIEPQVIDHSEWIAKILDDAGFCYDSVGDIIRIHGYLPKSFEGLE